MKVSVCVTTFKEKKEDVQKLLNALDRQTLKPDEVILIDANDYDNCSRSKGRNIAIQRSRNKIIAITDVGSTPHKDWLDKITKPFNNSDVDVVAGFYRMICKNSFQKAERKYLGVVPEKFTSNFLPSARSMAFTRSIWKKAGGFPESISKTAEDTLFNVRLINNGATIVREKKALVDWEIPNDLVTFFLKVFNYAKGDAETGIFWHPTKKLSTHNLKAMSLFVRYLLFINFHSLLLLYLLYVLFKSGIWGLILQPVSDLAVMMGFTWGIMTKWILRKA